MTTAPAPLQKKKRRKVKQMQGLLLLSAASSAAASTGGGRALFAAPPRKVLVALQPQQQQLAYSAQEDQDMMRLLGRIDLRGAQLEQLPDGFVVHERAGTKKVKLQDRDKATTDAWFFGVYAAITEFARLPVPASEFAAAHKFAAVLSASLHDEAMGEQEFELSCQLLLPARPMEKPSIRWRAWKTFAQLQAFDDDLRLAYGGFMKKLLFPRERKRDALFGLRKKHKQEIKEQQLALYIEQVFEIPGVSSDPSFLGKAREFLEFDSFFEIKAVAEEGVDETSNQVEADPTLLAIQAEQASDEKVPSFLVPETQSSNEHQSVHSQVSRSSSASEYEAGDAFPPLSRKGSQFEDVGTEYVEIVPETDPKAAKRLHKSILERVRDLVAHDEDRVREFQEQTKYFGRDEISTTEYCAFLLGAFGSKECCQLIPLMARLLPDDVKRDELMDGRSAIWRRTIRRNRRRSKQFSESVAFQQQRKEAVHDAVAHKSRPKSDSMTALQWYQEKETISHTSTSRHSMIETPTAPITTTLSTSNRSGISSAGSVVVGGGNQESGIDTAPPPSFKKPMLDPRRKLQHRASFNQFSETVTDPIQEENLATLDSEDGNQSTQEDHSQHSAAGALSSTRTAYASLERKSSLAGSGWSRRSQSRLSNVSSGSSAIFGDGDNDTDEGTIDYRHRRSYLKSELESTPPAEQEENPVLARLKKQGAINFMMR